MNRKTIRLSFPNGRGQILSGILDAPEDASPLFYGVFAPCFTCTKDSHGAFKICRAMAEQGAAMLRFDMTGLGESEGDFALTNFSTRILDIIAAAEFLDKNYEAPKLLVGHSISGTAALSAAQRVPSLHAVATIGSPSDPTDTMAKFRQYNLIRDIDDATIEIMVMGRPVRFHKSFTDNMMAQNVAADTAALNKKLFIFHAPNDDVVSFRQAEIINERATCDHTLIRLDDAATHLFETRKEDAVFIAETLVKWFRQKPNS